MHTFPTSSRNYPVKAYDIGYGVIKQGQHIVANGVVIVFHRDFGIRHIGIMKYRNFKNSIFDYPQMAQSSMKIHPPILDLLHPYTRTSPEMTFNKLVTGEV
jgi:hypothetical protein